MTAFAPFGLAVATRWYKFIFFCYKKKGQGETARPFLVKNFKY